MRNKSFLAFFANVVGRGLALSFFSLPAFADIAIIGHLENANTLTSEQVARIFLGKVHEFADKNLAKPIDQIETRPPRDEFLKKVLHKTESEFKLYWSTIVFTGNGSPPDMLPDDESVKKFVASHPRAIGYIDRKSVDHTVKILFTPD